MINQLFFTNTYVTALIKNILTKENTTNPVTISYDNVSYNSSQYNTSYIEVTNTKYDTTSKVLTFDITYNSTSATIGGLN